MKVYAITDIGRMRPINEDSYYLPREGERFCAVADGMGGHNAGEVASAMAVDVFSRCMRQAEDVSEQALFDSVAEANEAVFEAALENAGMSGMGTTFSALAEQGGVAYIAHVGDSRVYLVRDGAITRVTTDHTLVEEMVQKGFLTPREARVLRLRYGLDDGKARTLEEVGREFNVTRERIRQIEAKALRKLRHPSRSKKLRDFLN